MNNNLPILKKDNFFSKAKMFFLNLFFKGKKNNIKNNEIQKEKIIKNEGNNLFGKDLKTAVNNEYLKEIEKEDFVKDVEENPRILYNLSVEKIEKFIKYYEKSYEDLKNENKELEKEIEKLKKIS